jgi:hypothetical protein
MPKIDLEKVREQMQKFKLVWDFTITLNGAQHRMVMPTSDVLEAVRGLAAGKGDVFAVAASVVDPPAAGLDLDQALALLVTYVHTSEQWSTAIFGCLAKLDPGAIAVLSVLSPTPAPAPDPAAAATTQKAS